jgi:hypothetical protein
VRSRPIRWLRATRSNASTGAWLIGYVPRLEWLHHSPSCDVLLRYTGHGLPIRTQTSQKCLCLSRVMKIAIGRQAEAAVTGIRSDRYSRPARPPPAARQGPRRRALLRAARRRRPRARRRPLARALQPRVPARVRRVAARLPADAPARARRRAAAHDRPLGRRHLLLGRAAERRLVHDELHAHLRRVADRLPRARSRRPPQHALVPACVVRATAARNTARFEKTAARAA